MSTYMPKGKTERQWYVLDAEGRTLGEVAVEAAVLLRGKHKPTFAPHADCGDSVIIINAAKVVLTGNKLEDKIYYHHTGYVGNMKAVKGMLPDNTLGRAAMARLRVYAGAEHEQTAQKPIVREF